MSTSATPLRLLALGGALASALLAGPVPSASAATTVAPAAVSVTPECESACFLDVRTGAHTDFDRVVVDLGGPSLPTILETTTNTVGIYTESGEEPKRLPLEGKSYLTLRLMGVNNMTTSYQDSFTGPTVQQLALPSVKGYGLAGGYEGYFGFGLALGDYSSYKVFTLTSPNRLVIDVYH
ncbi:AMIN-like domain-containing (lipo)protein [Streptomyces sp. R-07]|uniref:AMIN-like domain-containing (lipo)protein n=1 Tax=unclassified Streptomyces TaxID=2593676 RepID=UPI0034176C74